MNITRRVQAGVTGILFGLFGVHKFILGYTREGLVMLAVTVFGGPLLGAFAWIAMAVVGLVEGIIYLMKSEEDFTRIYLDGERRWF